MFDLTPQIILNKKYQKAYRSAQAMLYALAFGAATLVAILILFPTQRFIFYFTNLDASKNNLATPTDANRNPVDRYSFEKNEKIIFGASLSGQFSNAKLSFSLPADSNDASSIGTIETRKSFQSFLYKEDKPVGFKDGSLLKNNENYYLVSKNALRKFKDEKTAFEMGFSKESFLEVSEEELNYNPKAEAIESASDYPESTLFKVENNYYILREKKLEKFLSREAYLTHYEEKLAIKKDSSFLEKYPFSENWAGYADGSLVSNGESVFVVSGKNVLPIDTPETFELMGYAWDDVLNVSPADIFAYERTSLFNKKKPHPDGTVYVTKEDSAYYLVQENQKHFLPSGNIAKSWTRKAPIIVSREGLEKKEFCQLEKKSRGRYECEIPLQNFVSLSGKYFEFTFNPGKEVSMQELNIEFENEISVPNLKENLKQLASKILVRYGI